MFVNKISGVSQNLSFKGHQHVIDSVGKQVELFGYPYDSQTQICEIEFARAKKNDKYNIIIDTDSSKTVTLTPAGLSIDPKELLNLNEGESYVYKIRIRDKNDPNKIIWEGADTGVKLKDTPEGAIFRIKDSINFEDPIDNYKWTYETTQGTTPMSNGAGYLAFPDIIMPGAKYNVKSGKVVIDENVQKNAEKNLRTFSNIMGSGIAGLIAIIPYLKENGYSVLFSNPIANGDDVSSHSYWNKNNFQIASRMGNTEEFAELIRQTYKNGIQYVYDGTFTSEGLEGIHFQYALRWAQKNPQSYYWFRMQGLKNSNLGLGVVPDNAKNLSHRIVNSPYNYIKQSDGTYKKTPNLKYNPEKETYYQIYDRSQVSDNLRNALDKQIRVYDNLKSANIGDINTHDDTIIAYAFQINPSEYDDRINVINSLVKSGKQIDLYSEQGTILASQFSNFKIDKKTEGGFVTWDANTDMVKMNYAISGYDLKNLKTITDRAERYYEQQMIERGAREVQDMTLQAARYWTAKTRKIQTQYTAQTIGLNKTLENINKLYDSGLLPENGRLTSEEINNILNGEYLFRSPKGVMSKDDITIKAMMELPLDAVEFGENVQGVLSTSYFSNRATTDETIGKTRFELLKSNNPHLVKEYENVYEKVNDLYKNELKNFADKVIAKVNATSNTKLIDSAGNYTEYGEYVMEQFGANIAKYAFLKSLAGNKLKPEYAYNGELTYNYDEVRANTTLKTLKINANNPEEEAKMLYKTMQKGLQSLTDSDAGVVADSVSKMIAGTDTNSYRLSEAIVNKASKGLAWRLDAAKDVMDQDAVRNREDTFDNTWDSMIQFWKKFVQTVKTENPNSYIVAELTDVGELLRNTYGAESCPYDGNTNINNPKFNGDNDAQTKFFTETGITSEAAYSYLFTNLLSSFSGNFEDGNVGDGWRHDDFKRRIDYIMQTRNADYLRNLYTFIGNHDKTRTIQGLATDMQLFQSPVSYTYGENGEINFASEREQRQKIIQVLSGTLNFADVPIELRLNVDNMDYFRTVSAMAVAQAKTLMCPIQEDLKGLANDKEIKALTEALTDLANGNYKIDKQTKSMTRINIPEITNTEKAIAEILNMAEKHGFKLSSQAREYLIQEIIAKINSMNLDDYQVRGDFNWSGPNQEVGMKNRAYLQEILGTSDEGNNYSLYSVQLARLIRDAYNDYIGKEKTSKSSIDDALKDFINKYDRKTVESNTMPAQKTESVEITKNKDSFGVKPFENAMEWVINQAEFKTGKTFTNKQAIIDRVVTSVTEPAIQKQAMILTYLKGLIGIPTLYSGDEYGMSGYEEKAKNIYLQNRNTIQRNNVYSDRYSKYTNSALKDRSRADLHSLNDGTPYMMDVQVNGRNREQIFERLSKIDEELKKASGKEAEKLNREKRELTKELAKVSYMMYSSNGDAVVSVFSAADVNHSNRFDYYKYLADEYQIDTDAKRKKAFADGTLYSMNPDNKYVPIQHSTQMDAILLGAGISLPIGTIFMNADVRDKVEYVVKDINGRRGIARKDGKKIIMDGKTAKNGVLLLKKVKNIIFKGNGLNSQYNIISNPYQKEKLYETGKYISVVSQ